MDKFREIIKDLLTSQASHSVVATGTWEMGEVEHSTPVGVSDTDSFCVDDISGNSLDSNKDVEAKLKVSNQEELVDSTNMRIKYSRDFLVKIRSHHNYSGFDPAQQGFPSLVRDVISKSKVHGRINPLSEVGTKKTRKKQKATEYSGSSVVLNVMGGPMKWGGMMIPPAPPTRAQPKVQLTLQREEVKLHKAENAWKPSTLKRSSHGDQASDEEQIVIDSIVKKTRGILNKLTPDNFDTMVTSFSELPFEGKDGRISVTSRMLYEKAMTSYESYLLALYARMVKAICSTSEEVTAKQFRKHVINICQDEFEVGIAAQLKIIEASLVESKDYTIRHKLQQSKMELRRRKFCNVQFIGKLFELDMLPSKSMMHCVQLLLRSQDEDNLDSVCKLLTSVGERLDMGQIEKEKMDNSLVSETTSMNSIFQQLDELLLIAERVKLSSRIRFAILDVVELRENGWKSVQSDGSRGNGGQGVSGESSISDGRNTQKYQEGKEVLGDIGKGNRNIGIKHWQETFEQTEALVTWYIKLSIAEKTGQMTKVIISVILQNTIASQEPKGYAGLLHATYKALQYGSRKAFKIEVEKQCTNELKNSKYYPHLYENQKVGISIGRFIGELHNLDILDDGFVKKCFIFEKIAYLDNLCGILIACGEKFDKRYQYRSKWINEQIQLLQTWFNKKLPPALRFEILKVLNLHQNKWKSENATDMYIRKHENVVTTRQENCHKNETSSDQDVHIGGSESANGVDTNSLTPNERTPYTLTGADLSGMPGNSCDSSIKENLNRKNLNLKSPFPAEAEQMTNLINEIFGYAVVSSEPGTYARMVRAVCQTSPENSKEFKKEIALKCKVGFACCIHLSSNLDLGIIRFIGELYNVNILMAEFVVECVTSLLNPINESESNLESLCELLTISGAKLNKEVSLSKWMDTQFEHLKELMDRMIVSSPVHSAIRKVVELRENQWKSQRNQDQQSDHINKVINLQIGSQSEKKGDFGVVKSNGFSMRQTGIGKDKRKKKKRVVMGSTGYPAFCWKD